MGDRGVRRPVRNPRGRRRVRRALRAAGWNAGLIAAGLALLAGAGELWLRSTVPFMTPSIPRAFVPGVGLVGKPGAEVRATNRLDFWQVSRFNREGFLDREPPRTEPAADVCHVTVIGDSFVEALQVPIAAKLHVRLEVLASRRPGSPHVTTSAFGRAGTGQVAQLAYYDEFARKRAPGLIVLVFFRSMRRVGDRGVRPSAIVSPVDGMPGAASRFRGPDAAGRFGAAGAERRRWFVASAGGAVVHD